MDKTTDETRLLTVTEAAEFLRIHPITLYSWVSQGRIPSIKMGRKRLFDRKELEKWLQNKKVPEKFS